jgi:hypothetical protein
MSGAKIFIPFFLLTAVACAATPNGGDTVWITRPDGSLQCDPKVVGTPKDPVLVSQAELEKNGVHVLEAKRRNDGRMHAQMCGLSTGNETSFRIPKADLAKAKVFEFEELK